MKKILKVCKRSMVSVLLGLTILSCSSCKKENNTGGDDKATVETYKNPIYLLRDGGVRREIADPSLFKYKNKYYALSTQMYSLDAVGMLVWESTDMVNWSEPKNIIINGNVDPMMAPELVYHEGSYYLYWSVPRIGDLAENHYLAKYTPNAENGDFDPFGDSAEYTIVSYDFLNIDNDPTGAFDIDGEIFFDKNDVYMFFCGMGGIRYKKLTSLDDAGNEPVMQLTDCVVRVINTDPGDPGAVGWTEAPALLFEDGYYYMTYSGNHFQSPTYQIHSARGTSIENIKPHKANPLIAKRDGLYNGMGNNNFIVGPDLKTKYTTYHTKIGIGIHTVEQGPINRQMMLDRYTVTESEGIVTDAPTFSDKPIPSPVEWENDMSSTGENMLATASVEIVNGISRVSNGEVVSNVNAKNDFVVEGNIKGSGKYGLTAVNGKLKFGIESGDLSYYIEGQGWISLGITGVVADVWHTVKIDKKGDKVKFYYDDRYVGETITDLSEEGKFGYFVEGGLADMSWIGQSNY